MSQITYRQLGPNNEPQYGNGTANFISDLEAVAQVVLTRLQLFQGEWWESLKLGLPMFQSILGAGRSTAAIAVIFQQYILQAPHVTGVSNVSIALNRASRSLSYSCLVSTQFGTLVVSNQPGSQATIDS